MKGLVMRSTGSWYDVRTPDGAIVKGRLRGKFKISGLKVTNPIAVGDWVEAEPEPTMEGWVAIVKIYPRTNYIQRQSVHKSQHGHLLAANVDQCLLFVTLTYPKTSTGFVDRFLVSAEAFRIPVVLVFNKIDLLDAEGQEELEWLWKFTYEKIGYTCLMVSGEDGQGKEALENIIHGKKSLIAGHSGTGKSTWMNLLSPGLELRTTEISDFAEKGVHTTTFAEMFELGPETFLIDSPGIKELGLIDIDEEELGHYFPEFRNLLGACKFHNCKHTSEPGCAVKKAVEEDQIAETRYQSYVSMLRNEDNRK